MDERNPLLKMNAPSPDDYSNQHFAQWRWIERILWLAFLAAAVLNMLHFRGGFLTNHLADVVIPALLYVIFSGLSGRPRPRYLPSVLRRFPSMLALVIFAANSVTEISQYFWPRGLFPGTFDPLDILSFAVGLLPCYLLDKRQRGGWPRNFFR